MLKYDTSLSRFAYSGTNAVNTIYTRTVKITGSLLNESKLTVTVSWSDIGNNVRHIDVTEGLLNWQ